MAQLELAASERLIAIVQVLDVSFNSSGAANQLTATALQALTHLPQLSSLAVAGNKLESLTALRRMTALTSLDVSQNQLSSLRGVSACTALQQLAASANALTTLNGLGVCASLAELQVLHPLPSLWLALL